MRTHFLAALLLAASVDTLILFEGLARLVGHGDEILMAEEPTFGQQLVFGSAVIGMIRRTPHLWKIAKRIFAIGKAYSINKQAFETFRQRRDGSMPGDDTNKNIHEP
jgi:hypothetical protein